MDVTVLDKKDHPVVKGLTRDDFTIMEDKVPQKIFSFEPPEVHYAKSNSDSDKAPDTIFVLDRLNSQFEEFAFITYSLKKYLSSLPKQLDSPSELMILGNDSLEMVQSYTRSRADLLYAVDHIRGEIPYKMSNPSFFGERFVQSMDALQQIALQNKGVPGRKNIIWVGKGGPGIDKTAVFSADKLDLYVHNTTNLLVDSRISLFVLYPGLPVKPGFELDANSSHIDTNGNDPFSGEINFNLMASTTGGKLFFGRNDVDAEIKSSEDVGSHYYTLTYQPPEGNQDGRFRHTTVSLRNPELRVVAKEGYYAPDKVAPIDARHQALKDLTEAAHSTIPFKSVDVTVAEMIRYPDTDSVGLTVLLKSHDVNWQAQEDGASTASVRLAAVSLDRYHDILASKLQTISLRVVIKDPEALAKQGIRLPITVRFPRKAQLVRVVLQTGDNGRLGAIEINRKDLEASPEAATPQPVPQRSSPANQPASSNP